MAHHNPGSSHFRAWRWLLLISIGFHACSSSMAQESRSDTGFNAFFDLHIHTSLKNYYRHVEAPDSLLLHVNDPIFLRGKYGVMGWLPYDRKPRARQKGDESNMINYDQANYSNLAGLGGSVLCLSITPPEKVFVVTGTDRWLNKNLVTHISLKRQEAIADAHNPSFKEFLGEYQFVVHQDSVVDKTKIVLAKNNADLRRITREGGIGLVMTIEGGHTLLGPSGAGDANSVRRKDCDSACQLEVLHNIRQLHELPHRLFFITVAHMGWNKLFGNAKSLDKPGIRRGLLTAASLSDAFRQDKFAKYGDGILGRIRSYEYIDTIVQTNGKSLKITLPYTRDEFESNIGYAVIKGLLDADNDFKKPIYIDCKHLDIKGRFQYYEYIDSVNKIRRVAGKKTIPIIASHIGLSGKKRQVAIATAQFPLENSYEELIFGRTFYEVQMNDHDLYWRNYTKLLKPADRQLYYPKDQPGPVNGFNPFEGNVNYNTLGWFYPWEINFCDEEISLIYESDGLLGLNLDKRILGYHMANYSGRYKKFLRRKFRDLYGKEHLALPDGTAITFDDYYLAEPLLRNIFHVVEVCGRENATAWDHLSLGTDFDGFIHPIALCPTANDIPLFHKKMVAFTSIFVELHNQHKFMYGLTAEAVMRKFFYTNGRDFIFKYFQE